jgi:hypothetical protein
MTLLKLLPDGVQASRPAASSTPLFQRRGTLHGPRLPFQHIQVVFQIKDLVAAPIASRVPCSHLVVMHDLYG